MALSRCIPVLAVADLPATAEYYEKVLGFRTLWTWGSPPDFGCVGLGAVELFLSQMRRLSQRIEGHQVCLWADDVQALYERHTAAGARIVSPIENKPWHLREYTVRDCNGYHLRFGGPAAYQRPPTALETLPAWIRVESGLPDYETYVSLFTAVDWAASDEASMRGALANSAAGVLATDTRESRVIGMARATGDGRQFMIWDVIVRPSHQGQQIGAALVERLLDELRRGGAPAGAFVGLLTGRPGFYERLGFKPGGGMHRGL
jgi:GNAT superfamily N-acetyltransferase